MESQFTLKSYIEHLTTLLNLPNTENIQKKIQKKFERTLKDDLKIWDIAETIPVAKTRAKVFKSADLEKAYKLNQDYLAKILKLDVNRLENQRQYNSWLIEQKTTMPKEEFEQINKSILSAQETYNQKYKVSLEEQNNVMLKAIFEKFFTPLDIKRWENDKIIIANTLESDELSYLAAQQRLDIPNGKAYYKEK